jgi:hypothetical protein
MLRFDHRKHIIFLFVKRSCFLELLLWSRVCGNVKDLCIDPAVLHDDDVVHVGEEADAVRRQDSSLVLQQTRLRTEKLLKCFSD